MLKYICFLILFISSICPAGLLIEKRQDQESKLLFKSQEPTQAVKFTENKKIGVRVIPILPVQKLSKKAQKEKVLSKSQKIQNEINAEIKSMNQEINLYSAAKKSGNLKEALKLLDVIQDRKLNINVLRQEKKLNTKITSRR